MSYVVIAPLVLAVDEDGRTHHVYRGGIIAWLSDVQAEHFLREGMVVEGDQLPAEPENPAEPAADPAVELGPADDGAPQPAGADRPATVATKDVLVDWLTTHGNYDRAELDAQTKDELWALIDATD